MTSQHTRCTCGYQASDEADLDEHILAMCHAAPTEQHRPAR